MQNMGSNLIPLQSSVITKVSDLIIKKLNTSYVNSPIWPVQIPVTAIYIGTPILSFAIL
jgi:hypothetical protein